MELSSSAEEEEIASCTYFVVSGLGSIDAHAFAVATKSIRSSGLFRLIEFWDVMLWKLASL